MGGRTMSDNETTPQQPARTLTRHTLLKTGAALAATVAAADIAPGAVQAAPALLRHTVSTGSTLVLGVHETSATMDPGINWDYGSATIFPACYEGLMKAWRGDTTSILEPDLAESYERSNDGLTYTFRLRKGIHFADGSPLLADAVKFTF